MTLLVLYYLIGMVVSIFNIWFYRYSKYKTAPRKRDSLSALFGVWLWPLQIYVFYNQKRWRSK